jgi:hypothetical protein
MLQRNILPPSSGLAQPAACHILLLVSSLVLSFLWKIEVTYFFEMSGFL